MQNLEYKVEGVRLDLYKNKEVCNNAIGKYNITLRFLKFFHFRKIAETDDLSLPAMYMSDFLKHSKSSEDQALTLLDCCSGKVEHLNLKHVVRY